MLLLIIFLLILGLNLAPAFAPPTWVVLSFIEIRYHPPILFLVIAGTIAATIGRLLLARLAKLLVRDHLLSEPTIRNLDNIRDLLQKRKRLTWGIFLLYAFSPFPSNQLFIAYGLTDLPLLWAAIPFFAGRLVTYTFWILAASEVAKRVAASSLKEGTFFQIYFLAAQVLSLAAVYAFIKIDWAKLIKEKKLGWVK